VTTLLIALGAGALIALLLLIGGIGVPIPEEVVVLSAGASVHRGVLPIEIAVAACVAGVLAGDLLLFSTARRLGPAALERPSFHKLLPPGRRARIHAALERRGGLIIFGARQLAGVRGMVFATAGIDQMPRSRFTLWDLLGMSVSVPTFLALGYLFSTRIDAVRHDVNRVDHYVVLFAVIGLAVYATVARLRRGRP
jgi:membrane protein DedA with SNARE-associated domain